MPTSRAEKLLCELIALPSVNPAFAAKDDPNAGEQMVAHFLAATAASAGLAIELQQVLPNRPNVIARLQPVGRVRQRVLLSPHLDTVPAAGPAQFTPRKRAGRIYGRGAVDTKGSVSAMVSALVEVAQAPGRPRHTEIVFAGLIDEEDGQRGSRALAANGFRADLAIVGEPTLQRIVTAHKGSLWLRFETKGVAAHGARPDLGKNAILEMAKVVSALEENYARQLRRRRHPLLGSGSISVGKIEGGTQANIVPDLCCMTADRRTLPGETEPRVRREIKELLQTRGVRATIHDCKEAPCLALETDPRNPLVRQFFAAIGQQHPEGVDYFCDAAVLAKAGIPSVVFGPGDIAQAHTPDEWISVRALDEATSMLVRFLRSLE